MRDAGERRRKKLVAPNYVVTNHSPEYRTHTTLIRSTVALCKQSTGRNSHRGPKSDDHQIVPSLSSSFRIEFVFAWNAKYALRVLPFGWLAEFKPYLDILVQLLGNLQLLTPVGRQST